MVQTDELYPYYTVMGLDGCDHQAVLLQYCVEYIRGNFCQKTDAVRLLGMTGRVTVFFLFLQVSVLQSSLSDFTFNGQLLLGTSVVIDMRHKY